MVGKRAHAFNKNYVVRRREGVFVKSCSSAGERFSVPIVSKCDYLGAVLSYTHFERDTMARRVRAADFAYSRLKQVPGSRRMLTMSQRLEVYDVCILRTLRRGIFTTGFGTAEARTIHVMIMRHLRFIADSPRQVTHETSEHLCERHRWQGYGIHGSARVGHGSIDGSCSVRRTLPCRPLSIRT